MENTLIQAKQDLDRINDGAVLVGIVLFNVLVFSVFQFTFFLFT